jgi:hypothetical protein
MILGLSLSTFTTVHVIISLVGIVAGLVALFGMLQGKTMGGWIALFLLSTILTSATGFLFPFTTLLPSHKVAILSLGALAIALVALYGFHLSGFWRWVYVVTAVLALYLNVFVGVVQAFLKIPSFNSLAPTQSEPPFLIAQLAVLAIFVVLGFLAIRKFHPAAA